MSKQATQTQIAEICTMLAKGEYDREFAQAIIGKRVVIKPKAEPSPIYRIRVNRGPLPSFSALKREFGEDNVSYLFDGRPLTKDKSRSGDKDVTSEVVDVLIKNFASEIASGEIVLDDGHFKNEDLIAWGLRRGWVPADEKETYAVGRDHEIQAQRRNWLVGLGAFGLSGGHECVLGLGHGVRNSLLRRNWLAAEFCSDFQYPFVRE